MLNGRAGKPGIVASLRPNGRRTTEDGEEGHFGGDRRDRKPSAVGHLGGECRAAGAAVSAHGKPYARAFHRLPEPAQPLKSVIPPGVRAGAKRKSESVRHDRRKWPPRTQN